MWHPPSLSCQTAILTWVGVFYPQRQVHTISYHEEVSGDKLVSDELFTVVGNSRPMRPDVRKHFHAGFSKPAQRGFQHHSSEHRPLHARVSPSSGWQWAHARLLPAAPKFADDHQRVPVEPGYWGHSPGPCLYTLHPDSHLDEKFYVWTSDVRYHPILTGWVHPYCCWACAFPDFVLLMGKYTKFGWQL